MPRVGFEQRLKPLADGSLAVESFRNDGSVEELMHWSTGHKPAIWHHMVAWALPGYGRRYAYWYRPSRIGCTRGRPAIACPADRAGTASAAAGVRHGAGRVRDLSSMFPTPWGRGGGRPARPAPMFSDVRTNGVAVPDGTARKAVARPLVHPSPCLTHYR